MLKPGSHIDVQGRKATLSIDGEPHSLTVNPDNPDVDVSIYKQGESFIVTGRPYATYLTRMPAMPIGAKRYAEVAAGLSGFLSFIARTTTDPVNKPIAVDPFEYDKGEELLTQAFQLAEAGEPIFAEVRDRLKELLESCQIIRDPTKVELANCTLEDVATKAPHILGTSNVVVDLNSVPIPVATGGRSIQFMIQQVERLERQLLRQGGVLITPATAP
jgi:hypothetical protein